jgi:hypothetical protein
MEICVRLFLPLNASSLKPDGFSGSSLHYRSVNQYVASSPADGKLFNERHVVQDVEQM